MKKKYLYNTTPVLIQESGINFGPFAKSRVWHIEKSKTVAFLGKCKIAEFIYLDNCKIRRLFFVEAKSSSPNKSNNEEPFHEYIDAITNKIMNSFNIYMASIQNRFATIKERIPAKLKYLDVGKVDIKLVLVINGHKKNWLPPIQDALSNSLRVLVKTWALGPTSVKVVNQDGAKKLNLVRQQ